MTHLIVFFVLPYALSIGGLYLGLWNCGKRNMRFIWHIVISGIVSFAILLVCLTVLAEFASRKEGLFVGLDATSIAAASFGVILFWGPVVLLSGLIWQKFLWSRLA